MTDNNAPIILQVVGNVCSLLLNHADSHYSSITHFRTVGELLCIFLNGEHNEKLFPADEIEKLSVHGVTEGNSEAYRRWLGNYDREELLRIVNDIYQSDDKYIEAMKPSQRFHVYLNFKQDAFVSALTEQAISFMMPVLHRDPELLRDYNSEYLAMLLYTGDVSLKSDFRYAARFLMEKNIDVPAATAYMFVSTNELAFWLLRYIMENDKYINACEFCGRYLYRSAKQSSIVQTAAHPAREPRTVFVVSRSCVPLTCASSVISMIRSSAERSTNVRTVFLMKVDWSIQKMYGIVSLATMHRTWMKSVQHIWMCRRILNLEKHRKNGTQPEPLTGSFFRSRRLM